MRDDLGRFRRVVRAACLASEKEAATATLPPPTTSPESVPVRLLLPEAGLPQAVVAGCLARLEMGAQHYGVELATHNGRPALTDALQEALDAVVYLVQASAEGAGTWQDWWNVEEALAAALSLAGRNRRRRL